ncbi:hypothetical protein Gotur_008935 [Gossypium turneri]
MLVIKLIFSVSAYEHLDFLILHHVFCLLVCLLFELKERLSRLEAVLAGNKDAGNQELSQLISELQAKLEDANAETLSEREKAKKLAMENEKLKYRIAHLVQAVKVADQKLECMRGKN